MHTQHHSTGLSRRACLHPKHVLHPNLQLGDLQSKLGGTGGGGGAE